MLIIEDRNAAAGLTKDGGNLLHHLEARIENLSLIVPRIVAMLADKQDAVHGQLIRAVR